MSSNTYPVFFESKFLTDSNDGIYAIPSSAASTAILQELTLKLTNTTSATRLVTLYAFSAGSASTTNAIAVSMTVPPYDYILIPVPRISKGSGNAVQGFCDAASAVTVQAIGGKLHVP